MIKKISNTNLSRTEIWNKSHPIENSLKTSWGSMRTREDKLTNRFWDELWDELDQEAEKRRQKNLNKTE